jgi:peptidoglycan glycosyltransferase
VNAPILRLFALVLVLFAALAGMTSYNSVINADHYRDNALNKRPQIEQALVKRGRILARDGSLLARSVRDAKGDVYRRRYSPAAIRFSHVIGYDYGLTIGRAGLEKSRNDALAGVDDNELTSIVDDLSGKRTVGDNVITNLDPQAQAVALQALNGRRGSVVALEPATGKVRVMASTPGFDPNSLSDSKTFSRLSQEGTSPLFNRATQAGYAPGSTMKVVTAAAALDSGEFTPESTVSGKSPIIISGVPLKNFSDEQFGQITLTTALTHSVNTVWAPIAVKLGHDTMADYMKRFGFDTDPPMDYPDDQMFSSGVFDVKAQKLIPTESDRVDIGRVGIGQERLRVTPLQMATVAATVANGGVRMAPHITNRIVDEDGRTVKRIAPDEVQRVMSARSAEQLTQMMANVVAEGTGTAAALEGIEVAGKTGTAELNIAQRLNQPWFIGFAPRSSPKVAVAVTLENIVGGQGGVDAAPIAKQVMESLLR